MVASTLSVGPPVETTEGLEPEPVTLAGAFIQVTPLVAGDHAQDLFAEVGRPEAAPLWTHMKDGPFPDRATFDDNMRAKQTARDPLFFALIETTHGRCQGHAALMRIDPPNRVIEIGNIMFGPALQRSRAATEAMYLLARYVFETLGYRRYEWKCDDLNASSKRAAARLGFTFEGVFRQHMIVKGRNRDTAWFSMLDHEWPARKQAFDTWLAAENFDADGRQKTSLAALNGVGEA